MSLTSRYTTNEAVDVEFTNTDPPIQKQTVFVSQVLVEFDTAPTSAGDVRIAFKDEQGTDLLKTLDAQNQIHVCAEFQPIPIPEGSSLKVVYANPDDRNVVVRFLYSY